MDSIFDLLYADGFGLSLFSDELLSLDRSMPKSDFLALLMLERRGQATMSELASDIRAPQSTITGIVNRLAKKKLISRERDARDQRAIIASLTPEGAKVAAKVKEHLSELFSLVQSALTAEELAQLLRLAQKLIAAFADADRSDQHADQAANKARRIIIE